MKRRIIGPALLSILLAGSGCARANTAGNTAADAPIKIGLIVSLSGIYKTVGEDMQKGFNLYLQTHGNKLGGLTVDLKVADEGDGSAIVVPPATKLIKEDGVTVLAGIVGAGSVSAVAPLLAENKVPLVGANGRPGKLDTTWIWHTSYISTEPGLAMGDYVAKNAGGPVWVMGPDYQGGHDEIAGFVETFTKSNGVIANPGGKATFTPFPQTTNFQPYFAQVQASNAKAVYCFYAGSAAVAFVKQYKEFGLAGKLPLYAAGFLTEGSVLGAEADAAAGIRNSMNYAPDLDNPANRTFVGDYLKAYNTPPSTFSMSTYDAAAVLDKAIAQVRAQGGIVTGESINAALAKVGQIDSPRGTWQFSPNTHTPVQRWYLREVRNDGKALANVIVQELVTLGG